MCKEFFQLLPLFSNALHYYSFSAFCIMNIHRNWPKKSKQHPLKEANFLDQEVSITFRADKKVTDSEWDPIKLRILNLFCAFSSIYFCLNDIILWSNWTIIPSKSIFFVLSFVAYFLFGTKWRQIISSKRWCNWPNCLAGNKIFPTGPIVQWLL